MTAALIAGIMAGVPLEASRLRGGRSMQSNSGRSSGSGSHPSQLQNGHASQVHAPQRESGGPYAQSMNGGHSDHQGGSGGQQSMEPLFPSRPGQPICDFYTKTGHCKFGEGCRFDHPPHYKVQLNSGGLPMRPGEPICSHYDKTGLCKYGPSCKFDHPERG